MPKANPLSQIAKKLASLQAKSAKINEEIKSLAGIVGVEVKKQTNAPAPVKAAPVKKALPNSAVAPNKKGRPAKK